MMTTAADVSADTASLVDREELLDRVGGDEELLREITGIFLDECPALVSEIQAAIDSGDAKKLERSAHTLKGSVANFGARAATSAAQRLESLGRKGQLEESPAAMAELLSQLQQLQPELTALAG